MPQKSILSFMKNGSTVKKEELVPPSVEKSPAKSVEKSPAKSVEKPSPTSVGKSTPKSVKNSTPTSVEKSTPKSVKKSTPKSVEKSTPKSVEKSTPKSVKKSTPKSVQKSPPTKRKRLIIESDESSDENTEQITTTKCEDDSDEISIKKAEEPDSSEPLESISKNSDKSVSPVKIIKEEPKPASIQQPLTPSSNKPKSILSSTANNDSKGVYDPSKSNYHPMNNALWNKGSRLKIVEALSNMFRSVGVLSPDDLPTCIHLCLNQLGPAYEGNELGVGDTILLKSLAMTTGVGLEHLKTALKKQGDMGTLAESIRSRQQTMFTPKPLTVTVVFNKLKEIAAMTGNSSQAKKVERICSLLVACRESEAKFLIRSLSGKLRIGLAEQSVLAALGQAAAYTPFHSAAAVKENLSDQLLDASKGLTSEQWKRRLDSCVASVKQAYCVCPSYEKLVAGLLSDGPDGLYQHCFIAPGVPVKPMLAHPTRGVTDVLKRFDEADFTCEYKYDGERAQIHILDPSTCHVYSRNQENNTSKYPDIVRNLMPRVLQSTKISKSNSELLGSADGDVGTEVLSCIVDSEVVAWDRQAGHILPFQVLSTRKRKDVEESDVKIQVCIYAFDLLYLNGISLIEKPLRVRRQLLKDVFPQINGEFMLATALDSADTEEIAVFLDESIKGNCEGLMVKTLDQNSTYEIAKRSHNWLKLKKDYLDGVGDTLDLVVIGGFHGAGKRTGRYGGFLLACYDAESEEYQTICKIGTGVKDEDLVHFSEVFKDKVIPNAKPYYQYTSGLTPDHWFEPFQVWEVKAADLSISPAHKAAAGLADPEKGISLRFPRFLRIRDDKKPEDATSSQQIYELYRSQEQIKTQDNQAPSNMDDDLY